MGLRVYGVCGLERRDPYSFLGKVLMEKQTKHNMENNMETGLVWVSGIRGSTVEFSA